MPTDTPPRPNRRRRRWVYLLVALLLTPFVLFFAARFYVRWDGERELAAARADADATDPTWQLPDLLANRDAALPPPEKNSAVLVAQAAQMLAKGWNEPLDGASWLKPQAPPPNHLPTATDLEAARQVRKETTEALTIARQLRRRPQGGTRYDIDLDGLIILEVKMEHAQAARQVATALELDALLASVDRDPKSAVGSTHAVLNAGRAIGDDPFIIPQLVRMACGRVAVRSAERVLGLGEPEAGLAELQDALAAEALTPWVRTGLRGERAAFDQLLSNIDSGKTQAAMLKEVGASGDGGPIQRAWFWTYRGVLPADHAFGLRAFEQSIRLCDQPPSEQPAVDPFEAKLKEGPRWKRIMSGLLLPAVRKVRSAGLSTRSNLDCAAVGIACERYRRRFGRWPDRLEDIPKDILPLIPTDPYDGRSLRFRQTTGGAVVYAVGPDRTDDGGMYSLENEPNKGQDVVFRLYNPDKRRLPPPSRSEPEDDTVHGEP